MKEILSKANQYVASQEVKHLESLYQERDRLDKSKCTCLRCELYRQSLQTVILNEEDRLDFAPPMDQDEERLYQEAIRKIKGL